MTSGFLGIHYVLALPTEPKLLLLRCGLSCPPTMSLAQRGSVNIFCICMYVMARGCHGMLFITLHLIF